jgi:hypothetical protein
MRAPRRELAVCALIGHCAVFLAAAPSQSPSQLASLTVPAERLPAGCSLRQADVVDPRVSQNPWTGIDPLVIATIREYMGDVPRVPDAPLSRREAAMFRLRLATGVGEAYAARYHSTSAEFVTVYAVTFDNAASLRATQDPHPELPRGSRFTAGRSTTVVGGKGSPCYEAVAGHVRSIAAR